MPGDIQLTYDLVRSSQVEREISRTSRALTIRDNVTPVLGKISNSFSQFDKSLDASNARVLAFGASAGLVLGVQRAFAALVRETIGVEKALKEINVILGLNTKNLSTFGNQIFQIAKDTGQTFYQVADAAKELSRQGLSSQETLKRTRDALILTRQSGLDAEDAVKAITSALNSFQKEALTSTQVINKLANVDANFAVSSQDLANAITRTGSAAEGAGVKFDELIGLVTAAQQITQRGGAVIAQALNSVFARISRPGIIEQLKELGVQIDESQNGIQKLRALSDAINNASQAQSDIIKDTAGGIRNLNVLSAVLSDLGNKYSFVKRATEESIAATDQAIRRNDELNQTYASLTNKTIANIQQVGAQFGKLTIGPGLENILNKINTVLEGSLSRDSESSGEIIGKGILKGLGEFISGPGLILVTAAIGQLVRKLATESGIALKTILGINRTQNDINNLLSAQPNLINLAVSSEKGLLEVTRLVNNELRQREIIAKNIPIVTAAISSRIGKGGKAAVGLIPAVEETMGAIRGGYRPGEIRETTIPNYGKVIYNSAEKIKTFPGFSQPAIMPPQTSKAGQNYKKEFVNTHGFNPYKSGGYVPNYALNEKKYQHYFNQLPKAGLTQDLIDDWSGYGYWDVGGGYKSQSPFLFRGTNVDELATILNKGSFQSLWSGYDKQRGTFVSNSIRAAADFADPILLGLRRRIPGMNLQNTINHGMGSTSFNVALKNPILDSDIRTVFRVGRNRYNNRPNSIIPYNLEQLKDLVNPNLQISKGFVPNFMFEQIGKFRQPQLIGKDPDAIERIAMAIGRQGARISVIDPGQFSYKGGLSTIPIDFKSKGYVPNFGIGDAINSARFIGKGLAKFGSGMGIGNIFGLLSGKTDPEAMLPNIVKFISQPTNFIKTREDLDSAVGLLNMVGSNDKLRELLANELSRRVRTISLEQSGMVSEFNDKKPLYIGGRSSLETYSKYRLFGGKRDLDGYFVSEHGGIQNFSPYEMERLKGFTKSIKINKDNSFSFLPVDTMYENQYVITRNAIEETLRRHSFSGFEDTTHGTKLYGKNRFLSTTHLLGRFTGQYNKARTLATYHDRWDLNLHGPEKQALENYLASGDTSVKKLIYDNPEMAGGAYGGNLNTVLLREIISRYKHSNPVTYRGFVKLRPEMTREDEMPMYSGLVPNYASYSSGQRYLPTSRVPVSVSGAISQLSQDEQRIFLGMALNNTSAEQLARTLGISQSEVIKKYEFAQKRLQGLVNQDKKGKANYSAGLIPNFSPLSDAIAREASAGIPVSQIRVGSSPLIRSSFNPTGLGVYNTKDEPMGLHQGISRAFNEGRNPKTYGVPNFAEYYQYTKQTIPQNDPGADFRSGRATNRLSLQDELGLEQIIKSLKQEAKITSLSLKEFSVKVKETVKPFNLISSDVEKIDRNLKQSYIASAKINKGRPGSDLFPTTAKNDLFGFGGGDQLPISPSSTNSQLERTLRQMAQVPGIAQARIKFLISKKKLNPASVFTSTQGVYSGPVVRQMEEEIRKSLQETNPSPIPPYVPPIPVREQFGPGVGPSRDRFLEEKWRARLAERNKRREQKIGVIRSGTISDPYRAGILSLDYNPDLEGLQSPRLQAALAQSRALGRTKSDKTKYEFVPEKIKNKPSLLQQIQQFSSRPNFQSGAIASSFVLPMLGATVAEYAGDKTPFARGIGRTAQSVANIGSYAAVGASFGGIGALVLGGAGALLETPKIIRSFVDTLPDLERELDDLKDKVTETNSAFGNVLDTNEKLKSFARGELKLSPNQYYQFQKNIQTELAKITKSNPQFSSEVIEAINSGDTSRISDAFGKVSNSDTARIKSKKLFADTVSLTENEPLLYEKILDRTFNVATAGLKDVLFSPDRLFSQYTGGLDNIRGLFRLDKQTLTKDQQDKVSKLVEDTVLFNNEKGENIFTKVIDKAKNSGIADPEISNLLNLIGKVGTDLGDAAKGMGSIPVENLNKLLDIFKAYSDELGTSKNISPSLSFIRNNAQNPAVVGPVLDSLKSILNTNIIETNRKFKEPNIEQQKKDNLALYRLQKDISNLENNLSIQSILSAAQLKSISGQTDIQNFSLQARNSLSGLTDNPIVAIQKTTKSQKQIAKNNLSLALSANRINAEPEISKVFNELYSNLVGVVSSGGIETQATKGKNLEELLRRFLPESYGSDKRTMGEIFGSLKGKDRDETVISISNELRQLESSVEKSNIADQTVLKKIQVLRNALNDYNNIFLKLDASTQTDAEEFDRVISKLDIQEQINIKEYISSIASSFEDITNNLEEFQNIAKATEMEFINLPKGMRRNRAVTNRNLSKFLISGQEDYNKGLLTTPQYRQRFLIPAAEAEFQDSGKVSNKMLGDLFKSGLGYNKRDYFDDLKQGAIELGDIMRQSFASAFSSFVDGSKSAEDAARQLGITIATNILNRVAEMGFNSFFGSIFGNSNSFFSGLFSKGGGRANGGLIGYANGGVVGGGSGIRDDVPAMLSNGSFVIKKSSALKYGSSLLNSINYGKGFAGGGISKVLKNDFVISGHGINTKGDFDVDSALSVIGQTDENNPHNAVKFGTEQDYINYLGTIKQYKEAKKQFENAGYQRLFGAYLSAGLNIGGNYLLKYQQQSQMARQLGMSRSDLLVGAKNSGLSPQQYYGSLYPTSNFANYGQTTNPHNAFYLTGATPGKAMGGIIKRFAYGGSIDTIPALLTGGEYVMNPDAVNRMGVGFMNRLNSGMVAPGRYASGGLVGKDVNNINPIVQQGNGDNSSQIAAALLELVQINKEIRDMSNGSKPTIKNNSGAKNNDNTNNENAFGAPQINITIQMTNETVNSSQTKENNTANSNGQSMKELAKLIEASTLNTIIAQQRDGGLLANTRKKQ